MTTDHGAARATDPATSHAAASVSRVSLRDRAAALFRAHRAFTEAQRGFTGHELAAALGAPLNSVTPRLAELRRAGIIKTSGLRENGQIIWIAP